NRPFSIEAFSLALPKPNFKILNLTDPLIFTLKTSSLAALLSVSTSLLTRLHFLPPSVEACSIHLQLASLPADEALTVTLDAPSGRSNFISATKRRVVLPWNIKPLVPSSSTSIPHLCATNFTPFKRHKPELNSI